MLFIECYTIVLLNMLNHFWEVYMVSKTIHFWLKYLFGPYTFSIWISSSYKFILVLLFLNLLSFWSLHL